MLYEPGRMPAFTDRGVHVSSFQRDFSNPAHTVHRVQWSTLGGLPLQRMLNLNSLKFHSQTFLIIMNNRLFSLHASACGLFPELLFIYVHNSFEVKEQVGTMDWVHNLWSSKASLTKYMGDKHWDNYLKNGKKPTIDHYHSSIDIILYCDK